MRFPAKKMCANVTWCNAARVTVCYSGVPRGGGLGGSKPLTPEIPKAHQNRAKLNPTVKTVKNC